MLSKYAKENGFVNTRYYVDNGYTGTNFNRPGFKQMMEDAEMGYITAIIVKDCCGIMGLNQKDLENQGFPA